MKLIQDRQSSGMKIDDWCAANGVTQNAYDDGLRKIRKIACQNHPVFTEAQKITTFKKLPYQSVAL